METLHNHPGAPSSEAHEKQAQLASWEDEGGKTALSSPARILLVVEDRVSADSLERSLHAAGYAETRIAHSGDAALAVARDFRPGVVLLDLNLAESSSYQIAHALRGQAQSRELRLIALTSSPEHIAREKARAAGFERYLIMPPAPSDLSDLLERLPR